MEPLDPYEHDEAEAEAQKALENSTRKRVATSTQEFISNRDALQSAWADEPDGRDEGW